MHRMTRPAAVTSVLAAAALGAAMSAGGASAENITGWLEHEATVQNGTVTLEIDNRYDKAVECEAWVVPASLDALPTALAFAANNYYNEPNQLNDIHRAGASFVLDLVAGEKGKRSTTVAASETGSLEWDLNRGSYRFVYVCGVENAPKDGGVAYGKVEVGANSAPSTAEDDPATTDESAQNGETQDGGETQNEGTTPDGDDQSAESAETTADAA